MNEIPEAQRQADIEYLKEKIKEMDQAIAEFEVERKAKARQCGCGRSSAELIQKYDEARDKCRVMCVCGARTRYYRGYAQAWEMWNKNVLAVK